MKEPMEMIKFFAVNQKVGKRIKEGKMVTVDYPFKYTQQDLDAVREAVVAEVLEIIDKEIGLQEYFYEQNLDTQNYLAAEWHKHALDGMIIICKAVLALKEGEQE